MALQAADDHVIFHNATKLTQYFQIGKSDCLSSIALDIRRINTKVREVEKRLDRVPLHSDQKKELKGVLTEISGCLLQAENNRKAVAEEEQISDEVSSTAPKASSTSHACGDQTDGANSLF